MGKSVFNLLWAVFILLISGNLFSGCANIDCPLEHSVDLVCNLYAYSSEASKDIPYVLKDTLTITAVGTDSILLNKAVNIKGFKFPLKYAGGTDTLLLHFANSFKQNVTDSLFIQHIGNFHFENEDCPAAIFHKIIGIHYTTHRLSEFPVIIDSVKVVRKDVKYENIENIRIYISRFSQ